MYKNYRRAHFFSVRSVAAAAAAAAGTAVVVVEDGGDDEAALLHGAAVVAEGLEDHHGRLHRRLSRLHGGRDGERSEPEHGVERVRRGLRLRRRRRLLLPFLLFVSFRRLPPQEIGEVVPGGRHLVERAAEAVRVAVFGA